MAGYDGIYSISSFGMVRRDAGGRGAVAGRVLTAKKNKKGYCYVDLSLRDIKKRRLIHQLVAESFLESRPSNHHHPNHIDGNKSNNSATNLEWATIPENNRHAWNLGLIPRLTGERNGRSKLTLPQVNEIRKLKGSESQREIASKYGVARSLIQRIHQGKAWSA